uniref:Dishevelled-binding antagonist of beta-catenin 3a n=1 Tax=Myripristis murdjan TaxID=586833 RepID=A0A667XU11_9TELE
MHRAFSFPVTVERSRTKDRLEASLAGLCELELRKQRQECLVLGALALGDPLPQSSSRCELSCFSSWGALQNSPWGLMQALEQQVGELRIDTDDGCYDGAQGDTGDSRPSSGTPLCCFLLLGDPLMLNGDLDAPVPRSTLPRSFSAPYPPLEGIAEEGSAMESWQLEPSGATQSWHQQAAEDLVTEQDYQQALRVEAYILGLIQRHTLSPRPCQPRTSLNPDPPYCSTSGQSTLHRKTPSHTTEHRLPDPCVGPRVDLSPNPECQGWGCDLLEGEACGGEAPSLEEDCYLALPYPHTRPHSLAGGLPQPLPSLDPNCGAGAPDLCCEPQSPQHYRLPYSPAHHNHNLVSAQYIPGQGCHAPVRSPRHYTPEQPKPNPSITSPDRPNSKSRASKKNHDERQSSKRSNSKTSRSQSENSLLGQRGLPERRYSTTERPQGRRDQVQNQVQVTGVQVGSSGKNGTRRWCSNLELSQDEGETQVGRVHRRPPRRARHGHPCLHSQPQTYHHHHTQPRHTDFTERAPLCQGEEGYARVAPAESESSMSEVYSPASSSLSSDSDESGGLVWPQQLPPRLASSSSSSSPSPQASANTSSQPKAFVKIKASHALKKKILRFRSGSLKVMTTV